MNSRVEHTPEEETLGAYETLIQQGKVRAIRASNHMGVMPYYSLASGFLSGKYRSTDDLGKSVRGGGIEKQVDSLIRAAQLALTSADLALLEDASALA